jgi:hypothetical protein
MAAWVRFASRVFRSIDFMATFTVASIPPGQSHSESSVWGGQQLAQDHNLRLYVP